MVFHREQSCALRIHDTNNTNTLESACCQVAISTIDKDKAIQLQYHCRFTQQELLAIDLEGRCVITDHGAFILFNLYGPAITSEENAAERFAYKLRLYQVSHGCAAISLHPELTITLPVLQTHTCN